MDNYINAINHGGGVPLASYCPVYDENCAGLVLCGGGDIASARFGQENCGSNPPDLARDEAELPLVQAYLAAGKPILGICRGLQIINVALGGTLIQDLPPRLKPFHAKKSGDILHPVVAEEGSLLHRLYGAHFVVNSYHHQGVDVWGAGFQTTAWSESGVVEGMEHRILPVLGVQFHPERMAYDNRREDTIDGALIFQWFLQQCQM